MPRHRTDQDEEMKYAELDIGNSVISATIDEYINGRNAERNRRILKRRLIDGILFEKIAEEEDLSPQSIKAIVKKGEDKIFKHLK